MAAITASTWAASTAKSKRDYVTPTTGGNYWYYALNAGTTDTSEPVWPTTPGVTVVDNDITWQCVAVLQLVPDFTYSWASADDTVIVDFEGGYEQRTSGVRGIRKTFQCQFVNRPAADKTTMEAFELAQWGRRYTFIYLDPVDSAYYRVRFVDAGITFSKDNPATVFSWSFALTERIE